MMKITALVISGHLCLLAVLAYFHPPGPKPTLKRPVCVHTAYLPEEKKTTASALLPPPPPPSSPAKTQNPEKTTPKAEKPKTQVTNLSFGLSSSDSEEFAPKILEFSAEVNGQKPFTKQKSTRDASKVPENGGEKVKTQVTNQASPKKPSPAPNREKLKQMAQKSLAALENKPESPPSQGAIKIAAAKSIGPLASESLTFESAYQDKLIGFLQSALTLPEKGDVKIALTVSRNGAVQMVTVKEAASEKNRAYVESTLPALFLPSFEKDFKGEASHAFSITLTSS